MITRIEEVREAILILSHKEKVACMSASRPSSASKDRRPSTSVGFVSGNTPSSASRHDDISLLVVESSFRPSLAAINPSHLRPMSAMSRPLSSMSRSSFGSSRLVSLDSLTEGPGTFQGLIPMFNGVSS